MSSDSTLDAVAELGRLLVAVDGSVLEWAFVEHEVAERLRLLVRTRDADVVIREEADDDRWGQTPWSAQLGITRLAALLQKEPFGYVVIQGFPQGVGSLLRAKPTRYSWTWAVRLVEAVAMLTEEAAAAGDRLAGRRLPLVHRTRFLLLNGPRLGRANATLLNTKEPLGPTLDERAGQARDDWFQDLVNHEDQVVLGSWSPALMDAELRLVVDEGLLGTDEAFDRRVLREAFLPRFMLIDAWKRLPLRAQHWALASATLLVVATLVTLFGLPGLLSPVAIQWAVGGLAGAAYISIVAGAGLVDRTVGYLACLRLPAGAAVGLLAVMSFGSNWVRTPGAWWLWAALTLLAASWGYLFLEAIAHGAPRWPALGRAALVTALGFAHGVAVAAIVIPIVGRAIVAHLVKDLGCLSGSDVSQLLVLAASVGLAVGVFLQVLWDDRPVTYPLTHLAWRGRGRA